MISEIILYEEYDSNLDIIMSIWKGCKSTNKTEIL
jgi:hypothetical protein